MACIVWQTEWQEGPGVREAKMRSCGVVPFDDACFAALAAWQWRATSARRGADVARRRRRRWSKTRALIAARAAKR